MNSEPCAHALRLSTTASTDWKQIGMPPPLRFDGDVEQQQESLISEGRSTHVHSFLTQHGKAKCIEYDRNEANGQMNLNGGHRY